MSAKKSNGVLLWNAREAKEHCEQFVADYAKMRADLLDHFEHKGHVALKYADDWDGFFAYCQERLKLESKPETIRLQISTAQVSREVGVDVPMVISRHLAKLEPAKQKGVYDEVIGAREVAGQRSANQMEPDVRRVVRRELGVVEKEPPKPPSVTTDEKPAPDEFLVETTATDTHIPVVIDCVAYNNHGSSFTDQSSPATGLIGMTPHEESATPPDQEAIPADLQENAANHPPDVAGATESPYEAARTLLHRWSVAYQVQDADELLAVYVDTNNFLSA